MLSNNLKYGIQFAYFGIQFANGRWYAWFNLEMQAEDDVLQSKTREETLNRRKRGD